MTPIETMIETLGAEAVLLFARAEAYGKHGLDQTPELKRAQAFEDAANFLSRIEANKDSVRQVLEQGMPAARIFSHAGAAE